MSSRLLNWLDHRTGYRRVRDALLIEHIPGGAKWRYVWGSCLAFVFLVQLITGLLLMTAYSPGDSTAWGSVYFIQYQMDFGWLIRGLHHFGSQTMVVLLGVHMLQVVIAGAHLPPREVNWWLGLALLGCVLALSLTGYLLPWDQKGYWATQVATNILGNLPMAGPYLQKIVVGGPQYGHHTLTRFFTLHVAVFPPLIVLLMIAHVAVFRRHGVTTPPQSTGEGWFWPDQAFRDMLISLGTFAAMLLLVLGAAGRHGHRLDPVAAQQVSPNRPDGLWGRWAHAGIEGFGANLDAPADPARAYPARPEWYFLFLFQLLKYFEGHLEIVGTVIIPGVVALVLCLVPLTGYGRMRRFGHWFGIGVVSVLLLSIATLTVLAIAADYADTPEAELIREEKERAHVLAERAVQMAAQHGIPPQGPILLLRRDPSTQGRELFGQHCAGCHRYQGQFAAAEKASDLAGFGSREWILDLLRDPEHPRFFGHTELDSMSNWVKGARRSAAERGPDRLAGLEREFEVIAEWLGSHPRGLPEEGDVKSAFAQGYSAFEKRCIECHTYEGQGGGNLEGPDFTGYGSAAWIRLMVMSPDHPLRYGDRNTMPAFRDLEGPTAELTRQEYSTLLGKDPADVKFAHLGDVDRELIIRFLCGDDRIVLSDHSPQLDR